MERFDAGVNFFTKVKTLIRSFLFLILFLCANLTIPHWHTCAGAGPLSAHGGHVIWEGTTLAAPGAEGPGPPTQH